MALALFTLLVVIELVPRFLCGHDAERVFVGDIDAERKLANGALTLVGQRRGQLYYHTGALRFDGQSAIAIDQMTVMGLAQIVLRHPELRSQYFEPLRSAAIHLVDPLTLVYAQRVYGHHGIVQMSPSEGHAYLGYINLGLGMLRAVDPDTSLKSLHDRLSRELADRLFQSPTGLFETYPGETWPPDVAAAAGSVGLHARLTGEPLTEKFAAWQARFTRCAVGADGYLVQRVKSGGCQPLDAPRGSGTAVAAYFLSFATPELSQQLHRALADAGTRRLFGFAAIREYATGFHGAGDGNAGPVLFGVSVGATGFALGSAMANADRDSFLGLYRTLDLFGLPREADEKMTFEVGGALGNALLLAMLTARQP